MAEIGDKNWKGAAGRPIRKPLELLARSEWSALSPRSSNPMDFPITRVFLVSTMRPGCYGMRQCMAELQKIQNFQMRFPAIPDIRYNFLITPTGVVYECRGWKESPSLPYRYTSFSNKSLFVAFSGDFGDPKVPVPKEMLESMELLFKLGLDYKYLSPDYEAFDL